MVSSEVKAKAVVVTPCTVWPAAVTDGKSQPRTAMTAPPSRSHEHALVDQLVTQVDAVQGRFGNTTKQAGCERAESGLAHVLVLVTHGDEEHAGGGAEASEVPHAHRALDEVVAERLDVHEHQALSGQCRPSGTRNGYSSGMMMRR